MGRKIARQQRLSFDDATKIDSAIIEIAKAAADRFKGTNFQEVRAFIAGGPEALDINEHDANKVWDAFNTILQITAARRDGSIKKLGSARLAVEGAGKALEEWATLIHPEMRPDAELTVKEFYATEWIAEQERLHSLQDGMKEKERTR